MPNAETPSQNPELPEPGKIARARRGLQKIFGRVAETDSAKYATKFTRTPEQKAEWDAMKKKFNNSNDRGVAEGQDMTSVASGASQTDMSKVTFVEGLASGESTGLPKLSTAMQEHRTDSSFQDYKREYTGIAEGNVQDASRADTSGIDPGGVSLTKLPNSPQDVQDLTLINDPDRVLYPADVIRAIDSHPENPNLKPPESPNPGP